MAKIVVMGAGIGGISQVYELRKELGKEHEIVLVGDSDRFEFTPSNPWVAVGWRKESQITVDLPDLMKKHNIDFSGAGVRRLHPDDNRIELNDDTSIEYDYLIIATGPRLAFEAVQPKPDKSALKLSRSLIVLSFGVLWLLWRGRS